MTAFQTQIISQDQCSENTPALFIDVDGVLFGVYGGMLQLRPYVSSFLSWAQTYFKCYWLTGWSHDQLDVLFSEMYFIPQMRYAAYYDLKTEAIKRIAPDGNFFWMDDDPLEGEIDDLMSKGWRENLIEVNPEGLCGLNRATISLCLKSGLQIPPYLTEEHYE